MSKVIRRKKEGKKKKDRKKERGYNVASVAVTTDTGARKEEIGGRRKS